MEKTLYLMRHGETLFNTMHKMQGWCDSPLTADGIAQAERAGAYLRDHGLTFDAFACGTAERACDTLELVMRTLYGRVLPYEREKDLREHGFGNFEGVRYDRPPGGTLLDMGNEKGIDIIHLLDGEPEENVGPRMRRCLARLMDAPDHERVLVVSSMDSIWLFLNEIGSGMDQPWRILNNCCVCVIGYDASREEPFRLQEIIRTNERDISMELGA